MTSVGDGGGREDPDFRAGRIAACLSRFHAASCDGAPLCICCRPVATVQGLAIGARVEDGAAQAFANRAEPASDTAAPFQSANERRESPRGA
jgi:hypothetical protein